MFTFKKQSSLFTFTPPVLSFTNSLPPKVEEQNFSLFPLYVNSICLVAVSERRTFNLISGHIKQHSESYFLTRCYYIYIYISLLAHFASLPCGRVCILENFVTFVFLISFLFLRYTNILIFDHRAHFFSISWTAFVCKFDMSSRLTRQSSVTTSNNVYATESCTHVVSVAV